MPSSRIPPTGVRTVTGGTPVVAADKVDAPANQTRVPDSSFSKGGHVVADPALAALGPEEREAHRLGGLLHELLAGNEPQLSSTDLRRLQAAALHVADRLFTNEFNTDGELKGQLRAKKGSYGDVAPSEQLERALFTGNTDARQADALAVILRTFQSSSDSALRSVALVKLGELGRPRDADVALLVARRGDASDLYQGMQAAQRIANRHQSPLGRNFLARAEGPLSKDPVIGPLLARTTPLSDAERTQVLEAVLSRGDVDLSKTKKHSGNNRNEVYFLTFKETLPGPNGTREPIRAVWKPENTWVGKDRAYWAREVAAFEFDKAFTQTGLVPVTVESVLAIDSSGHKVGSLQWLVADAKPLGKSVLEYDPKFDGLRKTDGYKRQEAKLRTLLYIFNDPDKLANNVHRTPNLQNVMVDKNDRLWMIDNAYSMGAPDGEVDRSILPKTPDPELAQKLGPVDAADVAATMGRYVQKRDAQDVAKRADTATVKP
ncbi:MAG: hypothetical protein JNK82_34560 [Myxococcaceae bacterium]|nr:hypothetical protein [Myxococcaceae bacterium]